MSEQDKQRIEKAAKDYPLVHNEDWLFKIKVNSFQSGAEYEHSHLSDLLSSQSKEIERLKEALHEAKYFVANYPTVNESGERHISRIIDKIDSVLK